MRCNYRRTSLRGAKEEGGVVIAGRRFRARIRKEVTSVSKTTYFGSGPDFNK